MKATEKVVLGCTATLLFSCLVGIVVLYLTGGLKYVGNTVRMASSGQSLAGLAKRFPFTPPIDEGVPEGRLEAYLAVCGKVKPHADELEEWHRLHDAPRKGFHTRSGLGASGLVADLMKELERALEAQRMGPDEFRWIHNRMRSAAAGPPPPEVAEEIRETIRTLQTMADDPQTPPRERERLAEQARLLANTPEAGGPAAQADRLLCERYADRLKACALGDHAAEIASGFATSRPGKTTVRVGKPSAPEPEK